MDFKQNVQKISPFEKNCIIKRKHAELYTQNLFLENENLKTENERIKRESHNRQKSLQLNEEKIVALNHQIKNIFEEQSVLNEKFRKVD